MKNLLKNFGLCVFFYLLVSVLFVASASAQTIEKTVSMQLTVDSTSADSLSIDLTAFMDAVEIIETAQEFATMEVVIEAKAYGIDEGVTQKMVVANCFGLTVSQENSMVNVKPMENDFYIPYNGEDVHLKRSFKLYVPKGMQVVQRL